MSGRIAFLRALTSLHPGAGAAIGAIDLPIQREAHTNWPMIQGGGVKGVFRDVARNAVMAANNLDNLEKADAHSDVVAVFGPPAATAGEHAGNLIVTDARILLFPVRSLKGTYALITSVEVLQRFVEDCALAGITSPPDLPGPPAENYCLCAAENSNLSFAVDNNARVVLEDMVLTPEAHETVGAIAAALEAHVPRMRDHLLVVHGDVFNYFVQFRTEVITRNAIDYEKKMVKQGALFNEEFLPPQTVMYSVLLAAQGNGVMDKVAGWIAGCPYMQFGGDATVGKGICRVTLADGFATQQGGAQNA